MSLPYGAYQVTDNELCQKSIGLAYVAEINNEKVFLYHVEPDDALIVVGGKGSNGPQILFPGPAPATYESWQSFAEWELVEILEQVNS